MPVAVLRLRGLLSCFIPGPILAEFGLELSV